VRDGHLLKDKYRLSGKLVGDACGTLERLFLLVEDLTVRLAVSSLSSYLSLREGKPV
jgi:hypothetical protein